MKEYLSVVFNTNRGTEFKMTINNPNLSLSTENMGLALGKIINADIFDARIQAAPVSLRNLYHVTETQTRLV